MRESRIPFRTMPSPAHIRWQLDRRCARVTLSAALAERVNPGQCGLSAALRESSVALTHRSHSHPPHAVALSRPEHRSGLPAPEALAMLGAVPIAVPHSSRGPGHRPLKAEITGSNPVCGTKSHLPSRFVLKWSQHQTCTLSASTLIRTLIRLAHAGRLEQGRGRCKQGPSRSDVVMVVRHWPLRPPAARSHRSCQICQRRTVKRWAGVGCCFAPRAQSLTGSTFQWALSRWWVCHGASC